MVNDVGRENGGYSRGGGLVIGGHARRRGQPRKLQLCFSHDKEEEQWTWTSTGGHGGWEVGGNRDSKRERRRFYPLLHSLLFYPIFDIEPVHWTVLWDFIFLDLNWYN